MVEYSFRVAFWGGWEMDTIMTNDGFLVPIYVAPVRCHMIDKKSQSGEWAAFMYELEDALEHLKAHL